MKNMIIAILAVALIALGWIYLQSKRDARTQSDDNEVSVSGQSNLTVGEYEFAEVAATPDLNGETFLSWQHKLNIIDENTFEYRVDGRMAMIRVRGTIEQSEGGYTFVAGENFLTEDGAEPFPKFDSGTVLFTSSYNQNSDSLTIIWEAASGNLPETSDKAAFVRN